MLRVKFPGIPGLAVGHIGLAGFGVVDDVGAQLGDLGHALLGSLDLAGQRVVAVRCLCRFGRQIGVVQQPVFGQVVESLGHLFEVEHLRPAGVSGTFPGLEFCLDVHQQIDLGRGGLHSGCLAGRMLFLAGEDRQQIVQRIAVPQPVEANIFIPALCADGDGFAASVNGEAVLFQQAQQFLQAGRFLCQCPVDRLAQLLLVGGLGRVAQPLVVALAAPLGGLHDGVAVLDADGVAQAVDSTGAAPKVAELPVTLQRGGVPYNMVVGVRLVDVGTDDKSVFAFGKTPGQLHAQPVGFLRRDLTRNEGLPQVVGDHVILAAHPAGAGGVGLLVQQELGVGHAAVALVAGDEPAVVGLVWIFYIVDDVADRLADRAALASVKRHDAGGGHNFFLLSSVSRSR